MNPKALHRILLVDDDRDIQAVTRLALEAIGGFTVAVCDGGRDALACAPEFAPDLVLLDVMMPGMDGPATLDALRALPATAHVPVVFLTARVQFDEIRAYRQMGAVDVIRKPFSPLELPSRLQTIWETCHV